ncbi:MAG TPA: hypothetical protein VL133_08410 [Devosia sp.]|nr:hypothetical protein [Devosia sp.]
MIRALLATSLFALMLGAPPTLADGKIYVQLPDLSGYEGKNADDFLYQVVLANIVSSNCPGFEVTEEEWSLLTDSADILAHQNLKLTADEYEADYYKPAFAALDDADTCATQGPNVQPILDELVNQGGSREALPDQDAAYEDWRAMQDGWAAAEAGSTAQAGKTKTK